MPMVVFAVTARIKLEQRLARQLAIKSDSLVSKMNEIEQTLQLVFPAAKVAIVQDLYSGFRTRDGEHILLVEVANSGLLDGLSVVKLGPQARLAEEWEAWTNCRPHGLRHDIVLMDLHRTPATGDTITALVYADAEQLIGVDQTLTLERAMIDSILFGAPTVESVAELLFQLYERLGLLLYRHSDDENLADEPLFEPHRLDRRMVENLAAWDRQGSLAYLRRVNANTETQDAPWNRQFRDPAAMFRYIIRQASPAGYVPRMLRGRSHGDLHGRNVLVGRVGNRVLWPAVYDFGNMSRNNWIGWDFVKMETELKIRAYADVFPYVTAAYVLPFEVKLFEATERGRDTDNWQPLPLDPTPENRLFWLLLQLRRLASDHLGQKGRSGLWLAEYYFQLALYGLNAGRFENLTPIEQKGAYLSAGCAAARFAPVSIRKLP